jgi:hypothetical protein
MLSFLRFFLFANESKSLRRAAFDLVFILYIYRGISVRNGNSVNQLSQSRQTAVSFAATSKQYSDECTFRSESNTAVTIYLHTHIYQYTPIICPAVLFPAHFSTGRRVDSIDTSLELFRARIGAAIITRGVFQFDFSRFQPLLKLPLVGPHLIDVPVCYFTIPLSLIHNTRRVALFHEIGPAALR